MQTLKWWQGGIDLIGSRDLATSPDQCAVGDMSWERGAGMSGKKARDRVLMGEVSVKKGQ